MKKLRIGVYSNFNVAEDIMSFLTRTGQVKEVSIQEKKRFWEKKSKWEVWAIERKW